MYKEVPISEAKLICDKYAKAFCVILAHDREFERIHCTTYGVSVEDKAASAGIGDMVVAAIGGDMAKKTVFRDFREDYSAAHHKACIDLLCRMVEIAGCDGAQIDEAVILVKDYLTTRKADHVDQE